MPQFSDDLYLGSAAGPYLNGQTGNVGSPFSYGVGPLGRLYVFDAGTPTALSTTAICAAQAIAGAANAVINGAKATNGVVNHANPRACQMVSSNAGDTTQTVTITGTDYWGQAQTERKTLNGTTPVLFAKAFKTITQVAVSGAMTGNLSVGDTDKFGLPWVVSDAGYIASVKWAGALAADAGTFVAADATSPATNSTGDVRGTYTPSSASNGSRRLVMAILLTGIQAGPNATQLGAIGVVPA